MLKIPGFVNNFPLSWKTPKETPNSFANSLAAKALFPTSDSSHWELRREAIKTRGAESVSIQTPDLNLLDGVYFPAKEEAFSKKAFIFAPGADGYYEDNFTEYLVNLVKEKLGDINILVLNYPGVMKSEGQLTSDSMALAVYSGLQFINKEKLIDAEQILIYGQSLGGIAAARAASWLQEENPEANIKVMIERSITNLGDCAHRMLGEGYVAQAARSALNMGGWKLDESVLEAYRKIKGTKAFIFSEYDGVAVKTCAIYQAVIDDGDVTKVTFLKLDPPANQEVTKEEHMRKFTAAEEVRIIAQMKKMI